MRTRPYIICHILSVLDGKIVGSFMKTEVNQQIAKEYGRIRERMRADAWLYGTTTTKEFVQFAKPVYTDETKDVLEGDFVAKHQTDLYYVSIDTEGQIGWNSGTYRQSGRPDCHVIEVITEKTSHYIVLI